MLLAAKRQSEGNKNTADTAADEDAELKDQGTRRSDNQDKGKE